jgi:site-specific recombinase XerD
VPLLKKTAQLLAGYIQEHELNRVECRCAPLFFNRFKNRLSRSGVRHILRKYADKARAIHPGLLEKISPHTFRHTKAMHILQATYDISSVQQILGHADISTTRMYTTADMNMKREALEKAAGLSPTITLPSWQTNKELMGWLRSL